MKFRNSPKLNSFNHWIETFRTSSYHFRLRDIENRIKIGLPVYEKLTKIGRPVRNVTFFQFMPIKTLGAGRKLRRAPFPETTIFFLALVSAFITIQETYRHFNCLKLYSSWCLVLAFGGNETCMYQLAVIAFYEKNS